MLRMMINMQTVLSNKKSLLKVLFGRLSALMRLLAILHLTLPLSSGNQRSKCSYYQELAHDQCMGVPQSAPHGGTLIHSFWFRKKQRSILESKRAMISISLGLQKQVMKVIVDLNGLELAESNESSNLSHNNMHFCSQLTLFKCDNVICRTVNWPRLHPQFWVNSNWGIPRLCPQSQVNSNWGVNILLAKSTKAFTNIYNKWVSPLREAKAQSSLSAVCRFL